MGSKKHIFFIKKNKKYLKNTKISNPAPSALKTPVKKAKPTDFVEKLTIQTQETARILYFFYSSCKHQRLAKRWKFHLLFKKAQLTKIFTENKMFHLAPSLSNFYRDKYSQQPRIVAFLYAQFFKHYTFEQWGLEVQTLFLLSSNVQQYFLNTLGINYRHFETLSSGRCLRKNFGEKIAKSLKKSFKLNKFLVEYYYTRNLLLENNVYTHTILRPFNKKTVLFLSQLQINSQYYPTILGFHKYYKTVFKPAKRIKKKIKKQLCSTNLRYSLKTAV